MWIQWLVQDFPDLESANHRVWDKKHLVGKIYAQNRMKMKVKMNQGCVFRTSFCSANDIIVSTLTKKKAFQ